MQCQGLRVDQSYRPPLTVCCPRGEFGKGQEAPVFDGVERSSKEEEEEEKQTKREKGEGLYTADDVYAGYQCQFDVQHDALRRHHVFS